MRKNHYKLLLLSILGLLSSSLFAQTRFEKTAGTTANDRNYHIAVMRDGGLVATGYTEANTKNLTDGYLLKYNAFGEVEWSYTFGDTGDEAGWDVIVTRKNEIVAAGYTTSLGTPYNAATLTKTDSTGKAIWFSAAFSYYGNLEFYRVIETSDGFFIATGLAGTTSFSDQIVVCKFTSKGKLIWSKHMGTAQADEAAIVFEASDGNYVIGGLTEDSKGNGKSDLAVSKLDTAGKLVWQKSYGGTNSERINGGLEVFGDYYFCGWTSSEGKGENDAFVMATDSKGNLSWAKTYGTSRSELCFNMLFENSDSSLMIAGYTETFSATGKTDNRNAFLMKTDIKGNLKWSQSYGGSTRDGHWPTGLAKSKTEEGYFVFSSTNTYGAGDYDLFLIKTDASGDAGCNQKDPSFSEASITGWKGKSFGRDSSVTNLSATATIAGTKWSLTTKSQCCSLAIDAGNSGILCPEDTTYLGTKPINGYAYKWTLSGATVSTKSVIEVTYDNPGTYTLEVSAAKSGCATQTQKTTLAADPKPVLGLKFSYHVCEMDTLEIVPLNDYDSLFWFSLRNFTLSDSTSFDAYESDFVYLFAKSKNACFFLDSLEIDVDDRPGFQFGSDTTLCKGDSIVMQYNGTYDYTWYPDSTNASPKYSTTKDGNYGLRIQNGACNILQSRKITVQDLPNYQLPNDTSICDGDYVELNAPTSYSWIWLWDKSNTDKLYKLDQAGSYAIEVSDGYCKTMDEIKLSINPLPKIAVKDGFLCGDNNIEINVGSEYDTYAWSNGSKDSIATINSGGDYWIQVTNSFGCIATDSFQITAVVLPDGLFSTDTIKQSGPLTLDAGKGYASYRWDDNSKTQTIVVIDERWHSVTVTTAEGCEITDSVYTIIMIGINEISGSGIKCNVFPNPTSGQLTVKAANETISAIRIYDLQGRLKLQFATPQISLESLENGIYLIETQSKSGKIWHNSVIKN